MPLSIDSFIREKILEYISTEENDSKTRSSKNLQIILENDLLSTKFNNSTNYDKLDKLEHVTDLSSLHLIFNTCSLFELQISKISDDEVKDLLIHLYSKLLFDNFDFKTKFQSWQANFIWSIFQNLDYLNKFFHEFDRKISSVHWSEIDFLFNYNYAFKLNEIFDNFGLNNKIYEDSNILQKNNLSVQKKNNIKAEIENIELVDYVEFILNLQLERVFSTFQKFLVRTSDQISFLSLNLHSDYKFNFVAKNEFFEKNLFGNPQAYKNFLTKSFIKFLNYSNYTIFDSFSVETSEINDKIWNKLVKFVSNYMNSSICGDFKSEKKNPKNLIECPIDSILNNREEKKNFLEISNNKKSLTSSFEIQNLIIDNSNSKKFEDGYKTDSTQCHTIQTFCFTNLEVLCAPINLIKNFSCKKLKICQINHVESNLLWLFNFLKTNKKNLTELSIRINPSKLKKSDQNENFNNHSKEIVDLLILDNIKKFSLMSNEYIISDSLLTKNSEIPYKIINLPDCLSCLNLVMPKIECLTYLYYDHIFIPKIFHCYCLKHLFIDHYYHDSDYKDCLNTFKEKNYAFYNQKTDFLRHYTFLSRITCTVRFLIDNFFVKIQNNFYEFLGEGIEFCHILNCKYDIRTVDYKFEKFSFFLKNLQILIASEFDISVTKNINCLKNLRSISYRLDKLSLSMIDNNGSQCFKSKSVHDIFIFCYESDLNDIVEKFPFSTLYINLKKITFFVNHILQNIKMKKSSFLNLLKKNKKLVQMNILSHNSKYFFFEDHFLNDSIKNSVINISFDNTSIKQSMKYMVSSKNDYFMNYDSIIDEKNSFSICKLCDVNLDNLLNYMCAYYQYKFLHSFEIT